MSSWDIFAWLDNQCLSEGQTTACPPAPACLPKITAGMRSGIQESAAKITALTALCRLKDPCEVDCISRCSGIQQRGRWRSRFKIVIPDS
jgi:hypothetical protein